jgi:hypothetical protein
MYLDQYLVYIPQPGQNFVQLDNIRASSLVLYIVDCL